MSATYEPNTATASNRDMRDRGGPSQPLLIANDLHKHFPVRGGLLNRIVGHVQAVDGVSFRVMKGETLGIVGESGCGKSTLARLLLHLIPPDDGQLIFDGEPVNTRQGMSLQELRRNVQMVFQDSAASLNPRLPVEDSIAYGPRVHGAKASTAKAMARDLLGAVGLDARLFGPRYPHELSGGQKQRVNIARALVLGPRLVILDEAVSALDKSVEAQVLNLLTELKQQLHLTYLFISHDLHVVQFISDRVLVMYLGHIVEIGPVDAIYGAPKHPYTQALLASRLSMDPQERLTEPPLSGDPPNPMAPPSGCRFRTRCAHAQEVCAQLTPQLPWLQHQTQHAVACHMYDAASGHAEAIRTQGRPLAAALPVSGQAPPVVQAKVLSTAAPQVSQPLVEVRNLCVQFVSREATVHAVNHVNLTMQAGEVRCIIGESGSGKSVTLRAMLRLLPPHQTVISGTIRIAGKDLLALKAPQLSDLRGTTAAMIFQEPMTALDPAYTIGQQIAETVVRHEGCSTQDGYRRAGDLLELVKVPSAQRRLAAYPHELSGGLRQRAMIAMALSCRPSLLLADEPTTALDATVQMQVLLLLRQLQEELGMGVIFVTHDLGVAAEIADTIAVMYAGRIVETGSVHEVLHHPLHPYTVGMLSSTIVGHKRGSRIEAILGTPPDLRRLPAGCSFAPRCHAATAACTGTFPTAQHFSSGRLACCIHVTPDDILEAMPPAPLSLAPGEKRT
jgi:peptide/nickel transport system ATP-binding protein